MVDFKNCDIILSINKSYGLIQPYKLQVTRNVFKQNILEERKNKINKILNKILNKIIKK